MLITDIKEETDNIQRQLAALEKRILKLQVELEEANMNCAAAWEDMQGSKDPRVSLAYMNKQRIRQLELLTQRDEMLVELVQVSKKNAALLACAVTAAREETLN